MQPVNGSNGFLNYVEYSPSKISLDKANWYFKQFPQRSSLGACSGVFILGKVLRHFDWYYNDEVEFVVKMKKDVLRGVLYDSIGIAAINPMLTRSVMQYVHQGMYHEYFDILPYTVIDGINEKGLYVQSNAVYQSDVDQIDVNPEKKLECCQ